MNLEQKDKDRIVSIVASRYFSEQGWKWIDLNSEVSRIHKAYEELRDQYAAYPYMSRDWYVSNSATKSVHMCENWDELSELVDFLNSFGQYFDFLVKDGKKALCIASSDGCVTSEQKNAIAQARSSKYNVFVFRVDVPEQIEFELMQIGGGV